jgi:hypothetical protein
MKPQIVMQDYSGIHNANMKEQLERLDKGKTYQDLSTICICPTRGVIPAKCVQSFMGMMTPMNQKFTRIFMIGMEVGAAYNAAIQSILDNPELSKWKYILTLEEDNMPPPDGLLKLYESIGDYSVVSGLYWTKGYGMDGNPCGQPMIYGDPKAFPKGFQPQKPIPDTIQECNGLGMGFTLFKMDLFRDERIPKPWFKTLQEYKEGQGARAYTQDLYFYENAAKAGHRFASDNRVKVGHYDYANDQVF